MGKYRFSIQGNTLTGSEVLDALWDGFSDDACDLAGHLMNALAAVSRSASGDRRCTEAYDICANAAFLRVDSEKGETLIELDVQATQPNDAVEVVRNQFKHWRERHECPPESEDGGGVEAATRMAVWIVPGLGLAVAVVLVLRRRRGARGRNRRTSRQSER